MFDNDFKFRTHIIRVFNFFKHTFVINVHLFPRFLYSFRCPGEVLLPDIATFNVENCYPNFRDLSIA